jgi:hypothetical protein
MRYLGRTYDSDILRQKVLELDEALWAPLNFQQKQLTECPKPLICKRTYLIRPRTNVNLRARID